MSSSPLASISATIGVSIVPGQIALMRIPRGAYSSAALLVRPMHAVLGGVVGGAARQPDQPAERRAVDDRAAALFAHLPQLVLHARPDAAQVDRVHAVEGLGRLVGGIGRRSRMPALLNAKSSRPKASTVRSTSAATCSSSDTSQTTPSAWWPAEVSSVGRGPERLLVAVGEHDGGAGLGERLRGGEPHARGGAGDERHPVGEVVRRVRSRA